VQLEIERQALAKEKERRRRSGAPNEQGAAELREKSNAIGAVAGGEGRDPKIQAKKAEMEQLAHGSGRRRGAAISRNRRRSATDGSDDREEIGTLEKRLAEVQKKGNT